jgi:hypothetical protein
MSTRLSTHKFVAFSSSPFIKGELKGDFVNIMTTIFQTKKSPDLLRRPPPFRKGGRDFDKLCSQLGIQADIHFIYPYSFKWSRVRAWVDRSNGLHLHRR